MSQVIEIKVPDIGDYDGVPVIEVHVKPGDVVEKEQSLVTLESDKATMDVPSSHAGVVKEVKVKVGESISEGHVVILLEEAASSSAKPAPTPAPAAPQKVAALKTLADEGQIEHKKVAEAIKKYGLDPKKPNPMTV